MKVMIITCHAPYNYGAVLQAYALQTYLESEGQNVQIIHYCPKHFKRRSLRNLLIFLGRWPDYIKCKRVFGRCLKNDLHLTEKVQTFEEIKSLNLDAGLYIAGSDQIWNVNLPNGNDPSYYLKFAIGGKKISYAASIALENPDKRQKRILKEMILGLDAVSVREKSAVGILKDCGFEEVCQVVDPVYLLKREEWISFSSNRKYQEEYVLIYGFCRQREIYRYARRLADQLGCKVYAVNTLWSDIRFAMDRYFWAPSVNEFVNLIHHAKAVVTNSFHGLSFSLIFHKEVHVFETNAGGSIRLKDMLKFVSLKGRLIDKEFKEILKDQIDYEKVDEILEEKIGFSKEYLDRFLDEEG